MRLALLFGLALLTGCDRHTAKAAPAVSASSGRSVVAPASAPASVSAVPGTARAPEAAAGCTVVPAGGAAVPLARDASDLRIAASGLRALITWVEPRGEAHGRRMPSRIYDDTTKSFVAEQVLDENEFADVIGSGVFPLEIDHALAAAACTNSAPSGILHCARIALDGKHTPLFSLNFGNAGPQDPGGASVVGPEPIYFLPEGGDGDVAVFVASVSARRKTHTFAPGLRGDLGHAHAIVATRSDPDEATVVFRLANTIRGRRAGFDEKWRGAAVTLSEPKTLVGGPVVTSIGEDVVALFSARATSKAPWAITRAVWNKAGVTRAPLGTGASQAQAPGIVVDGACSTITWVEGDKKQTQTRAVRTCMGAIDPAKVTTISQPGVEGGRAYLARSADATFVAWEEFAKNRELRAGRLVCP